MVTSPIGLCRSCRLAMPAHAAATAGFSTQEGEIPLETDCLLERAGFELLVRGRGEAGCRAFDAPSYLGRVGSRRSDPANRDRRSREQIPVAVFRVGRSIFDATRHAGVFVVPVAPANAMGSPSVVTGPFSAVNRGPLFCRLIPSAGAARHHPICPGPIPDPKSIAKPIHGICIGSAKSWG